jgi:hypothetical protein
MSPEPLIKPPGSAASSIASDRQALTRKRRFRHLERGGLKQTPVGCDDVALLDQEDVAENHFSCDDALSHAIPNDVGMRRRHPA